MVPHWNWKHHPEGTTSEEFEAILRLRAKTMQEAGLDASVSVPAAVQDRWGFKLHWRNLGRDRDGSLKVTVFIQGPRGELAYARNYRLVKKTPLPYELGKRLRES